MPLYEQIIAASKAAAFEDPRFQPLSRNELKNIVIEISILSKPELIKVKDADEYLSNIEIGKRWINNPGQKVRDYCFHK